MKYLCFYLCILFIYSILNSCSNENSVDLPQVTKKENKNNNDYKQGVESRIIELTAINGHLQKKIDSLQTTLRTNDTTLIIKNIRLQARVKSLIDSLKIYRNPEKLKNKNVEIVFVNTDKIIKECKSSNEQQSMPVIDKQNEDKISPYINQIKVAKPSKSSVNYDSLKHIYDSMYNRKLTHNAESLSMVYNGKFDAIIDTVKKLRKQIHCVKIEKMKTNVTEKPHLKIGMIQNSNSYIGDRIMKISISFDVTRIQDTCKTVRIYIAFVLVSGILPKNKQHFFIDNKQIDYNIALDIDLKDITVQKTIELPLPEKFIVGQQKIQIWDSKDLIGEDFIDISK